MAPQGPSLMKLSVFFLCEWRSSCCCVLFTPARLCVPPRNCVTVTSSHFVFICICENGLILLNVEQPQLSVRGVGLWSCMHSVFLRLGSSFSKALNIIVFKKNFNRRMMKMTWMRRRAKYYLSITITVIIYMHLYILKPWLMSVMWLQWTISEDGGWWWSQRL